MRDDGPLQPQQTDDGFDAYFAVADETTGPDALTLEQMDAPWVEQARAAATNLGLPWPPEMAAAEAEQVRRQSTPPKG
jgi:hypothetical protein